MDVTVEDRSSKPSFLPRKDRIWKMTAMVGIPWPSRAFLQSQQTQRINSARTVDVTRTTGTQQQQQRPQCLRAGVHVAYTLY